MRGTRTKKLFIIQLLWAPFTIPGLYIIYILACLPLWSKKNFSYRRDFLSYRKIWQRVKLNNNRSAVTCALSVLVDAIAGITAVLVADDLSRNLATCMTVRGTYCRHINTLNISLMSTNASHFNTTVCSKRNVNPQTPFLLLNNSMEMQTDYNNFW